MSLKQKAYDLFKEKMHAGELTQGQFLSQRELAELLGLSLAPVREAINKLETEGVVQVLPQRGIQIVQIDANFIRNAYQLRILLEREAAAHYARNASSEEIIAAARSAHAHDFILAKPPGYDTIIGDQGALLSGGQRQRIAIARALLIDPTILILDEAASALDAESERHVQEAIEMLHGGRTILIVAHRLSTIMKADRIYVLEAGEIVESGRLPQLLAMDGRFRQLYDMQFRHEETG